MIDLKAIAASLWRNCPEKPGHGRILVKAFWIAVAQLYSEAPIKRPLSSFHTSLQITTTLTFYLNNLIEQRLFQS